MFQRIYHTLFDKLILSRKSFAVFKDLIHKNVTIKPLDKILDIGCGTGAFSLLFKPENYTGIEISPKKVAYCQQKFPNYTFLQMSGTQLNFPDNCFDVILVLGVFHHIHDTHATKMLEEIKRVLKPRGTALVIEPTLSSTSSRLNRYMQFIDKGEFIRYDEQYQNLFTKEFKINTNYQFITELLYNEHLYILKK